MADRMVAQTIYEWLLSLPGTRLSEDESTIYFDNIDFLAMVVFYDWVYIEMSIQRRSNNELMYYQQYELQEIVECRRVVGTFLHALACPKETSGYGERSYLLPGSLKVLISCTSGASSSWFARLLREKIAFTGLDIQVDAVSILELEKRMPEYDLVLLTPQIASRYRELNQKYGNKLIKLQPLDYATRNTDNVLHQISSWYQEQLAG